MFRAPDGAILSAMTEAFTHCAVCGERIGVYEPIVVSDGACRRVTALTREPLLRESRLELSHEACAQRSVEEPTQHGADALGYARADY